MDIKKAYRNSVDRMKNKDKLIFIQYYPNVLYKYRSFDDYTIDMIENNYLFLSPAKKLDDQFDCTFNFDLVKIKNTPKDEMVEYYKKRIIKLVKRKISSKLNGYIDMDKKLLKFVKVMTYLGLPLLKIMIN